MALLDLAIFRTRNSYIVIDTLDECIDRVDLLSFLKSLAVRHKDGVHLLITSHFERDITEHLTPVVTYEIDLQNADVDKDVRLYIQYRLGNDRRLSGWSMDVRNEIEEKLVQKAGGA